MSTMYKTILYSIASLFFVSFQVSAQKSMKDLIDENFAFARDQYKIMAGKTTPDLLPQSYDAKEGKLLSRKKEWWCTGFYPGSLWYIYEQTLDKDILAEAERTLKIIEPNQTYTGNHDLGFMMFCSFGNAYRITKKQAYKDIIFRSAESLSTRYRPSISAIQSWDKNKYFNCPVIIDNMMNLEMLNWVSANGGDAKYRKIAVTHTNSTIKHHFRPDFSSFHLIDFDLNTGKVIKKATWQGAANTSAWARGQAWALYGFVNMYRDTKDPRYLSQAENIAKFLLEHPNLPEDKIPFWDFDAPLIPFAMKDASAGAIIASALLELSLFTKGENQKNYIKNSETILRSLSSDKYRSKPGENGGFLLLHSTGALPLNSEIDVPLIYADYYFLEALKRYKDWVLK